MKRRIAVCGVFAASMAIFCLGRAEAGIISGTRLSLAAKKGNAQKVQELLGKGGDPNYRSPSGETPLFFAAWEGSPEVAKVLLDAGASVDVRDESGRTPLWVAADFGHLEMVELLLESGAEPRRANRDGDTALHRAAKNGGADLVRVLLDAGAVPTRNRAGKLPSAFAKQASVAALLRRTESEQPSDVSSGSSSRAAEGGGSDTGTPTAAIRLRSPRPGTSIALRQPCPNSISAMLYVADGPPFYVDVVLSDASSLADLDSSRAIVMEAIQAVQARCPNPHMLSRIEVVITAPGYSDTERPAALGTYRSANIMQQEGLVVRNRVYAARTVEEFERLHGVQATPAPQELVGNPFLFEDRIVASVLRFVTMETADIARFEVGDVGSVLIRSVPRSLFRRPGQEALLAGRVVGKTTAVQGVERSTTLDYVASYPCRQSGCAELSTSW